MAGLFVRAAMRRTARLCIVLRNVLGENMTEEKHAYCKCEHGCVDGSSWHTLNCTECLNNEFKELEKKKQAALQTQARRIESKLKREMFKDRIVRKGCELDDFVSQQQKDWKAFWKKVIRNSDGGERYV